MSAPRMRRLAPFLLALAALAVPAPAHAAPVTWVFAGILTNGFGSIGSMPVSELVGEPFALTIVFDDAAVDSSPLPTAGVYNFTSPPYQYSLQIGDIFAIPSAPSFIVGVSNDFEGEDALVSFPTAPWPFPGVPDLWIGNLEFGGFDNSGTLFPSDALFSEALGIQVFDTTQFLFNGCSDTFVQPTGCPFQEWSVSGQVQTWTAPEPATGVSAASALTLGWLAFGRRRRPSLLG